ncbi:hypothetical protein K1T71_010919 [Dendrolimus kikuchii]|uniref:Uncharacterized protein n=1 Tax=Dendrolimus kikuchii TaxID=765133 RepID=A0ACC1CQI0_9NEOP|nr:hypothetical protein K1T71_010919 [Dendrolimus kikuchii]
MDRTQEVILKIENQVFKVEIRLLCEHSDYFTAMFSGNYVEKELHEISIDVIDANSMNIILQYMQLGLIDLSKYPLSTIGDLAIAANFLQITELMKQIEYCLDLQLSLSNWMETMVIAENTSYKKLEQLCAAFGLLSFKSMKPEYIPSIHKLCWYLSHPYLDASNELDVFKFGFQWISRAETGADALLIILGSLDFSRITSEDFNEIKQLIMIYQNSLAFKVVDCLFEISSNGEISEQVISERRRDVCKNFTERVYNELLVLVKESLIRKLRYTPTIPVWLVKDSKLEAVPHSMYTFNVEKGFEKWLEVADKNLWGWSVTSWGANKLVVVCGEHGRGTGMFMRDVKVYDTFRNEWTDHGVQLPQRRHAGVTVFGDTLYLIGGVGGFRVVLDTAVAYDLKQRSFRKIAKLPDTIQNPAVCTHKNKVYATGHKNIYRYEDFGAHDLWRTAVSTDIRVNCMVSYKKYIYCTQSYFRLLYRFQPDVDEKLVLITSYSNPTAGICTLDDCLMAFTSTVGGPSEILSVEVFKEKLANQNPQVVWTETNANIRVNEVAGTTKLVIHVPPVKNELSAYLKRYLTRYTEFS